MTTARGTVRTLAHSKLALVAAVALGLSGCDKGAKKDGAGGSASSKGMAGASAVAPKGGLTRALSMMPVDSEMVFAIDFTQVRGSAMWKSYEDQIMGKIGKDLAEFKDLCGWDPIAKATGAVMAGRGAQMGDMTVFVKGFDKPAVSDCLKKAEAKGQAEGKDQKVLIDGDYFELTKADNDPIRFMFVDADTIVMQRLAGDMAGKAALEKLLAAKAGDGLMSSPMFSSLIDATDTGATVWFVVNGAASFMKASPMPMKMVAILGSVRATAGVDGKITLRMGSDDDAKGLVTMAKMSMGQIDGTPFAEYAKGVKIDSKGKDVNASFKFTQAQIEAMVSQARMLGGF